MATPEAAAETIRRSVNPLVHILAPPQLYRDLTGRTVEAATHDVLSRSY
jgi:2-methylaconitate cis-trans-isomerase PrpF